MHNEDINEFIPSILNPRGVRKQHGNLTLTQNSIVSRCSLSLKKRNRPNWSQVINKTFPPGKENTQNNNSIGNSIKNLNKCQSQEDISIDFSLSKERNCHNTFLPSKENTQNITSSIGNGTKKITKNKEDICIEFSLSQDPNYIDDPEPDKENAQNVLNSPSVQKSKKSQNKRKAVDRTSIGLSDIEDIHSEKQDIESNPLFSFEEVLPVNGSIKLRSNQGSLTALSSATELEEIQLNDTTTTDVGDEAAEKPVLSVSFGILNCEKLNIYTKYSNIKNIVITRNDSNMNVDCKVVESSNLSVINNPTEDDVIEISSDDGATPPKNKKLAAAVNLEIKKKTENVTENENSDVLILKTDAIERLSHVIVQPPNYKLVKRKIFDGSVSKFKNCAKKQRSSVRHGIFMRCESLKQKRIDSYFVRKSKVGGATEVVLSESTAAAEDVGTGVAGGGDAAMSKNPSGAESARCDRSGRVRPFAKREVTSCTYPRNSSRLPPSPIKSGQPSRRSDATSAPNSPNTHYRNKNGDSIQFNVPPAPKQPLKGVQIDPKKGVQLDKKTLPYHKFVAGTHFAVDAFSYGDIPNVKHYFLTHFHSDHYSGLKKNFDKMLFCTRITADLCMTRLGVHSKNIHIINFDEPITIDEVEITAVDANHCPGAMMLVFTLPNGKTLLHTGDFRASAFMESYPVFWNKDIDTIYLDSTYCNPRYDFPSQDQCIEMALYALRQKKLALEKVGKKFSTVLIVCGTYTIGKEKFFMGVARRVGCNVWACPEKDKVLQAVEGRSFSSQPPATCQLHVVPMRDLTHEKLKNYLGSLHGAFAEVVAFKPSGWENCKTSTGVERDSVTIHGIPYSEHSSFSEMIRFVKFLQPKQVVPTVEISGGFKAFQKYFQCPLVSKETLHNQSKVTDFYSIQTRQHVPAVT